MANQTISQLPDAGPITGDELVPIVQNGGTYKTTALALAGSPVQTQTFLTKNQELTLPNSRYLSTSTGLGLTDGGATSFYRLSLTGAAGSLDSAAGGFIVKDSGSTVVARSMQVSGAGLGVSNADGTGGDPVFQLTGLAAALANMGGTGMLAVVGGTTIAGRQILGTANQISVANGNGGGDPTVGLADDAVLPGTGAVKVPVGNTAQQPAGSDGQIRFNTDTNTFDGFAGGSWNPFTVGAGVGSFSAGSTGLTPSIPTTGAVVLGGVLSVEHGGTGETSLTGYVKGNGVSAMTASATVPTSDLSGTVSNAQLANSSVTFNGTTVALGGSGTITATASNALTIGTGLSGTSYNGSTPVTIAIANTGVTAASKGAASKTLTATVNAQGQLTALADTDIAIANTQVSGLGTLSTQDANNVAITGGAINGTTIGASTAAAGTFTSVATSTGTITTTPVNATDIVNKTYVDGLVASGIHFHQPVRVESPINLNATYNNGTAGVGATLTNAGTQVALVIDGVTLNVNDRVLVYQQTGQTQNGIYVVTDAGSGSTNWILTRSSDADTYVINSAAGLSEGSTVFVQEGATGAGETYTCNTSGVITFGTTNITFAQISSAQIYSAGTGLTLTGTQFSITNTGVAAASYGSASAVGGFTVNSQGQLTTAAAIPIAINANQITSGSVTNAQLQNSAVTVNGTSISLGSSGTITAANPNALTIGTGLTGTSYDGSSAVTVALGSSGVTPATYGSASQVPVFAVDTYGRVTSVTNTPIAISAGSVSGLAASATTDTTNAANISSGTLPTGRLSGSYTGITAVGTLTAGTWNATAIGVGYGGTGLTATPTNGQLAIGNGSGYTLATLTAGTNVSISNSAGGITINATPAAGGTVTSVDVSGGTTGLTTSGGPVTTSGTITLAGTLGVANGGTGATTLTGYVKGSGTSAMTASTTIPNTDITGLGTMSTQNASGVAITGGTINGATVGATTAATVRGTTITATTQFSGSGAGLTSIPNSATTATSANTASAIVARDASGNFSAGTITASLSGNATTATTATNLAGGAANRIAYNTGSGATSFVVAPTAANTYLEWSGSAFQWSSNPLGTVTSITAGAYLTGGTITTSGTIAVDATSANTASKVVARDASGNFSAGAVTATALTAGVVTANQVKILTNATDAVFAKDDNLTSWEYSGKNFSVTGQETAPAGMFFSPDGTRMYVMGTTGDDVNQYSLSTAWDVTTASFVQVSATVGETAPAGVFFKPDGTVMYVTGTGSDTVREFSLSTAWDVSTIAFVRDFSVAAQDTAPSDIWFKPDGLKMYMVGATNDRVYEYDLATAWDVSTASFVQFFSLTAQDTSPVAVNFTSDGTRMYVLGGTGLDINRYSLSTPWDISTAVFFNNFYIGFQETAPTGMFIDLSNDVAYVVGSNFDRVFQYATATDGIELTSSSGLFISGSLYTNKNLVVTDSSRIDGQLVVSGAITASSTLTLGSTLTTSGSVSFNTGTGTISIGSLQTTGTTTIGGTSQTGAITIGRSTATNSVSISSGATTSGSTKTINFGTGGLSGSTTNINVGSTNGTTITLNGTVKAPSGISGGTF